MSVMDLAKLIGYDQRKLYLMAQQPRYRVFSLPKKDGGKRMIEHPDKKLKDLQSELNRYLQSVYYFEKTAAAYGFVVNASNDRDRRDILTNAQQHLDKPYLLNIDLKEFFHHIHHDKVEQVFKRKPFQFHPQLAELLAKLTTYNKRLPMGTPTSPVLSNLACRPLDFQLINLANQKKWTFTRYADDMSFSAKEPITEKDIASIENIVQNNGFLFNQDKVKLFGEEELKEVTGLVLKEKVELQENYIPELKREIAHLKSIMEVQNLQGDLFTGWVDNYQQQLRGKMNFVGQVMGRRDPVCQELYEEFRDAIHPPEEEFGAISWRMLPYKK